MDCSGVPVLDLGDLAQDFLDQLDGRRHPLGVTFEVTERCNHSCVHCYINQPAGDRRAKAQELTFPQIQSILDQLVEAETLWLLFTGGEGFVRPDFLDIYTYAKRKGVLVSLFTNGTMLTPAIADYLAEWRPYSIEITLYGYTQETYERVTGLPWSHGRCMRAIYLLLERGLPLSLKSVVLTQNYHEVEAMKSFAKRLGVNYRYDSTIWPRLDEERPLTFRLSPSEIVKLDVNDDERCEAWVEFFRKFGGIPARAEYLYTCGAGVHSCHIDSYGRLTLCMLAREPSYDLQSGCFRDGWEDFLGALRRRKRQRETKCVACELRGLCDQCPGWAQLVHGDNESPVDFLCQVGHLRAAQLNLLEI